MKKTFSYRTARFAKKSRVIFKKPFSLFLAAILTFSLAMTGCSSAANESNDSSHSSSSASESAISSPTPTPTVEPTSSPEPTSPPSKTPEESSGESNEDSSQSDDNQIKDQPELLTNQKEFIRRYKAALNILPILIDGSDITVEEDTSEGFTQLKHRFNGKLTNVWLYFTTDGVVLTSTSTAEDDMTTALLCMAEIMNFITPTVGSLSDTYGEIQNMLLDEEIIDSGVTKIVGNVKYRMLVPGAVIMFSASVVQ